MPTENMVGPVPARTAEGPRPRCAGHGPTMRAGPSAAPAVRQVDGERIGQRQRELGMAAGRLVAAVQDHERRALADPQVADRGPVRGRHGTGGHGCGAGLSCLYRVFIRPVLGLTCVFSWCGVAVEGRRSARSIGAGLFMRSMRRAVNVMGSSSASGYSSSIRNSPASAGLRCSRSVRGSGPAAPRWRSRTRSRPSASRRASAAISDRALTNGVLVAAAARPVRAASPAFLPPGIGEGVHGAPGRCPPRLVFLLGDEPGLASGPTTMYSDPWLNLTLRSSPCSRRFRPSS